MIRIKRLLLLAVLLISIGGMIIAIQLKFTSLPSRVLMLVLGIQIIWILIAALVSFIKLLVEKYGKKISKTGKISSNV